MPNAVIKRGSTVKYAVLGENVTVEHNTKIGDEPEYYDASDFGISVIGKGKVIEANTVIKPKEII